MWPDPSLLASDVMPEQSDVRFHNNVSKLNPLGLSVWLLFRHICVVTGVGQSPGSVQVQRTSCGEGRVVCLAKHVTVW